MKAVLKKGPFLMYWGLAVQDSAGGVGVGAFRILFPCPLLAMASYAVKTALVDYLTKKELKVLDKAARFGYEIKRMKEEAAALVREQSKLLVKIKAKHQYTRKLLTKIDAKNEKLKMLNKRGRRIVRIGKKKRYQTWVRHGYVE